MIRYLIAWPLCAGSLLGGCSSSTGTGDGLSAPVPHVTQDAATRSEPVVVGRPARVFVFAGLNDACRPLPSPEVTITQQPAKGALKLIPDQATTIRTSAKGTCVGQTAKGTAVYYTAREGADGTDRFAVSAKLGSGETVARTFEVTIAQ